MLDGICSSREIDIIVIVLLVALILSALGKGAGKFLSQALSKFLGGETTTINIGANGKKKAESCFALIDPEKCPAHAAEKERSLRNEREIADLSKRLNEIHSEINKGLKDIAKQNAQGFAALHSNQLNLLVGLVKSGVLDERYVPKNVGKPIYPPSAGED